MQSDLNQLLTKARADRLHSVGIQSIYSLLTFFPRKIQKVSKLTNSYSLTKNDEVFFFTGTLTNIESRRGKRPFMLLTLKGDFVFTGYFFSTVRYIYSKLKVGTMYQVLVSKNNNLWSISKIEEYIPNTNNHYFVLGKLNANSEYLVPIYPKVRSIGSAYFQAIHRQIPSSIYKINLKDLIPQNDIIPLEIDLSNIHHPTTLNNYKSNLNQLAAMNVFLKLSLIKYLNLENKITQTRAGELDKNFYNLLIKSLPYKLSSTQSKTINDILQDIIITK
jgi:RecG-like helicase